MIFACTDRLAMKAAFDALVAKVVEPEMTCFGDWGVCDCIGIIPP